MRFCSAALSRWMNTSSRPRLDLAPGQVAGHWPIALAAARRGRCPRHAAPGQTPPPPRRPAIWRNVRAATSSPSPVASKVTRPDVRATSSASPCTTMRPLGEIDDALAALRLVHVMGRDQHGEAFGGHVVDQVPEFAARLGVDAGGRLVEQQQFRLVQHAGGQRQALLPAARELPASGRCDRASAMRSMISRDRRGRFGIS